MTRQKYDGRFAERFVQAREHAGFTKQIAAAKALEIPQSMLSAYESGQKEPRVTVLLQMADVYHVSPAYLLMRTDNPEGDA